MRLGQHFLRSKKIAKRIVEAAGIKKNDIILEVGPGKGILTEELLKYAKQVIAVEKDKRLFDFLAEKFHDSENLVLICDDILDIWARIASQRKALRKPSGHGCRRRRQSEAEQRGVIAMLGRLTPYFRATNLSQNIQIPKNYKVVANIPYYITSRFLRNFLSAKNQPREMVLMVQKEVAERINANPPRMNLLAISVQVYGKPKILFNVSKKHFFPQPKVDSAVIAVNNISRGFFSGKLDEKIFFKLVKAGFSHKRKLLINNLKQFENKPLTFSKEKARGKKEKLEKTFEKCEISFKVRAENLSLSDWKCLTKYPF